MALQIFKEIKMKLIICNVAWMKEYRGITENDYPINGGKFIEKHGYGHEVLNFKKIGQFVYGYVQAKDGTININRLDPDADEYTDNVLVVWRAKSKEGSVIIGWYKDARVYREEQDPPKSRKFKYKNKTMTPGYHIRALAQNATLIPVNNRVFPVPVTHKGFGSQTFVSYLERDNNEVKKFKEQLKQYIIDVGNGEYSPPNKGKRKPIDQESKLLIEKTAIDKSIEYYRERGYDVESVEKDNVGYDLLATKGKAKIFIEVKGTSVKEIKDISIGLTPNEYKKSKLSHQKYRICIVPDTFGEPIVYEFKWNSAKEKWFNEHFLVELSIHEMVAANLNLKISA
jgi:hypothetical protein